MNARHRRPSNFGALGAAATSALGRQGLQFALTLVVARLILPSDYGAAVLAMSVTMFAQAFTDLGLVPCIVTAKNISKEFLNTAFTVNVASGIALSAIVCISSIVLHLRYDINVGLLSLSSLTLSLGTYAVPIGVMERGSRFKEIAAIELSSTLAGGCFTVALAACHLKAYAIVAGPVLTTLVLSLLAWWSSGVRCGMSLSHESLRAIWRFSWPLASFESINYWSRNSDNWTIARVATSTQDLGLYARAYSILLLPLNQISGIVVRVALPRLAASKLTLRELVERWSRMAAIVTIGGAIVGLLLVAFPVQICRILFGDSWVGSATYLRVLGLALPFQAYMRMSGSLFQAAHMTRRQFNLGMVNTATMVFSIVVCGVAEGPPGVPFGVLVGSVLNFVCGVLVLGRIPSERVVLFELESTALVFGLSALCLPLAAGLVSSSIIVRAIYVLGAVAAMSLAMVVLSRREMRSKRISEDDHLPVSVVL